MKQELMAEIQQLRKEMLQMKMDILNGNFLFYIILNNFIGYFYFKKLLKKKLLSREDEQFFD